MDERAIGGWGELHREVKVTIPEFMTKDYQTRESAVKLSLMAYDAGHRHYKSNSSKIEEARARKSKGQLLLLGIAAILMFLLVGYVESPAFDLLFH